MMKLLWTVSISVLVIFLLALSVLAASQNWDDEKTFWTKNSIRNFNVRFEKLERRMDKAERPRTSTRVRTDGTSAGRLPIRPRRPLTLYERTFDLQSMQRQLEHINDHHNRMFHIWYEQLEEINEQAGR